eukprot:TRINITY_DN2307_c0_g1_i5.p1 TRINITY_DN2307_c0_g1~~TRINITY_DN2307_c0_g1_i5.p1  ORF type:complete len:104 (+),score=0.43 TRINITY_DN2307_c0_g1_i5:311-622(+)
MPLLTIEAHDWSADASTVPGYSNAFSHETVGCCVQNNGLLCTEQCVSKVTAMKHKSKRGMGWELRIASIGKVAKLLGWFLRLKSVHHMARGTAQAKRITNNTH